MTVSPKRIPMYMQLKTYLIDQIRQGVWMPGDKLPSENELAGQFDVSRITIKNAMADLVHTGLVYRIQGRGSYVSTDALAQLPDDPAAETARPCVAFLMPRLDNLFTSNLLTGIEQELAASGYHLLFRLTHDAQQLENKLLQELAALDVQGIIVYPVEGETFNDELLKLTLNRYPLVIVDRYLRGLDANSVSSDNVAAAHEATRHLTDLGHNRISFMSTAIAGTTSIEERLRGYEQALSDAGLLIDYRLRLGLSGDSPYFGQIKAHLQANPDVSAILAANSTIGLHALKAARDLNLRVPEELAVVCFDDYEHSELSDIPLTYVDQREKTMGGEAAKLVLSLIRDPMQERRSLKFAGKLVVRSSTARS